MIRGRPIKSQCFDGEWYKISLLPSLIDVDISRTAPGRMSGLSRPSPIDAETVDMA